MKKSRGVFSGGLGMLAAALIAVVLMSGGTATGYGQGEFSTLREELEQRVPNWRLYWAQREGVDVVYLVDSDPVLQDDDPGGDDDFVRMVLALWEDAAEHWASLSPSDEMGTCTIGLARTSPAMTIDGGSTEIVRINVFIGAAQADILDAMRNETCRDMADRRFTSWLTREFVSFVYNPFEAHQDDVIAEENAQLYWAHVQKMVRKSAKDRHLGTAPPSRPPRSSSVQHRSAPPR